MYISRGFSHGISSPVTEVGLIFFVFLSVVRFLFPLPFFFFFLLFPISRRTERMIIEFPNGVHHANLFLDFQGTAELSVTVASVQLHRESLY